jgi:hypothetical protein
MVKQFGQVLWRVAVECIGGGTVVGFLLIAVLLAFPDLDPGCELHHGAGLVLADRSANTIGVADIGPDQRPPAHGMFMSRAEII